MNTGLKWSGSRAIVYRPGAGERRLYMSEPVAMTVRHRMMALLGLSRVLQALLSLAEPAFVALVALRAFPEPSKTVFAVSVAAAGYLAVFAANDLFDVELDRRRFSHLRSYNEFDIDSAVTRHPLAQGHLTFAHSITWVSLLTIYALIGSYLLNPLSAVLFVTAALLEAGYCKLAKVTAFKFLASGVMVAVGALAGWFAVVPVANVPVLAALFLWMYGWEVGGRNIVNDWSDVEEDVRLGVKTVPVVYGHRVAIGLIILHLVLTGAASIAIGMLGQLGLWYFLFALITGWYFLLAPGVRLLRNPKAEAALFLFNRASLYPPAMLIGLVASFYLPFL